MPALLFLAAERSFLDWVLYFITKYWSFFLFGLGNTLLAALIGTVLGFIIGLAIGVVRTIPGRPNEPFISRVLRRIVNFLLVSYIEIFRGTPMMVQAMVIFYGLPTVTGIHLPVIPAGIFIVSINTGAYLAEIVRGGIISIDRGQFEAAQTLGMTHTQTMVNIILPQAIRNILPALGNEFVINIKDSSVLNVIGFSELYFMAKSVAGSSYRYFEVYLIICVVYFIITFTITRLLRLVEKRLDGPDNFAIHGSQTVPEVELKLKRGHFGGHSL